MNPRKKPPENGRRAIFFDRDGVLNQARVVDRLPFSPRTIEEFVLYPEAKALLATLRQRGFLNIVVTNQPEVGRGTLKQEVVEAMHRHLADHLPVDQICVCYDSGGESSSFRRKPEPGMLLEAAAALTIDLPASFVVGDRWKDIEAGKRAGCTTVWLDRGYAEPMRSNPDHRVESLDEAVRWILSRTS